MANARRIAQVSDWIEYQLGTVLLDPPVLRVKLRPMDGFDSMNNAPMDEEIYRTGQFIVENALAAVVEWDVAEDGKPLPLGPETKLAVLRALLGEPVAGRGILLGLAIFRDSRDKKAFLGN